MNFFLFITEMMKLNTVIVEGSYLSGIPVKTCTNQDSPVVKAFTPYVSTWWKHLLQQWLLRVFLGRSPPALHSERVKPLPILQVKIVFVLPSLMGIVDGPRSSSLAINVPLGSSQDFDWATQEYLFSSYSATPVWICLCASDHCPVEMWISYLVSDSWMTQAGFHQGFSCTLHHPLFLLSWQAWQSLMMKSSPIAWCCHNHAGQ